MLSFQGMRVECDTLIVGGGMAGSSAAYSLCVKEGVKDVVLLEQWAGAAPKQGSSHGDSRMYRRMYSDPFYASMQEQALQGWSHLEEHTCKKVLHENGLLFYGQDTGDTVEGSVKGAAQTMRDLQIPHEELTADEMEARWPNLRAKARDSPQAPVSGVFEATAGHINSGDACRLMIRAAEEQGLVVRYGEELVALHPTRGSKVECECKSGRVYVAKRAVVLGMGPWTGDFLKTRLGLELDLTIWRIHYAHYDNKRCTPLPQAFNFRPAKGSDGGLYFCFPTGSEKDDMPSGRKVGTDFISENTARDVVHSMRDFDAQPSQDVLALMDEWVRGNLAGIGQRVAGYCAPYTMITDEHYFIIDKLPAQCLNGIPQANVVVFAGGNGRAFKFAPLIGDRMASLSVGKEPPMDISKFSIATSIKSFVPPRINISPELFRKIAARRQVTEEEIRCDTFAATGGLGTVRVKGAGAGAHEVAAAPAKPEKKTKRAAKLTQKKNNNKGCC